MARATTATASPSPNHPTRALELRAETTTTTMTDSPPELCGFVGHTASYKCPPGQTCKFNTDHFAVGCCSDDVCDWRTTCCGYTPSALAASTGLGLPACGGPDRGLIASWYVFLL